MPTPHVSNRRKAVAPRHAGDRHALFTDLAGIRAEENVEIFFLFIEHDAQITHASGKVSVGGVADESRGVGPQNDSQVVPCESVVEGNNSSNFRGSECTSEDTPVGTNAVPGFRMVPAPEGSVGTLPHGFDPMIHPVI